MITIEHIEKAVDYLDLAFESMTDATETAKDEELAKRVRRLKNLIASTMYDIERQVHGELVIRYEELRTKGAKGILL